MSLRYLTAGESHGAALTAILDGFPSGMKIDFDAINYELKRRQGGYGRGKRQQIETDLIAIESGIYHGETTGAPLTLRLINKETAIRVAVGALAKQLLVHVGIEVIGYVVELGGCLAPPLSLDRNIRDASQVYSLNPEADAQIIERIDQAKATGDTLGGVLETVVSGCPMGLGSHTQFDRKLDARLAAAVMSIQAVKAVEFGLGCEVARRPGSQVMDPIRYVQDHDPADRRFGFRRPTNNAGGIEGGTTNGEAIVVRAFKKPISTLAARGPSIRMATLTESPASYERSDVCAVPAASVIMENVVAFEIASAVIDKFGCGSLGALQETMSAMHERTRRHLETWPPAANQVVLNKSESGVSARPSILEQLRKS